MSEYILEFELPLKKIHDKIETLKKSSVSTGIDVTTSIEELEKKLLSEKHKIYSNLSRWQRLELARHPNRPYSSDYIESITDNWIELHGDRKYADDLSIICGIAEIASKSVMIIAQEKGTRPGRPNLQVADIDYGGVRHGLTQYVQNVVLYEDMDRFGITGYLHLLDVDNIVSGFMRSSPAGGPHAIVGQELLYLKFRTFGSDLPVDFSKHPLHVHIEFILFHQN